MTYMRPLTRVHQATSLRSAEASDQRGRSSQSTRALPGARPRGVFPRSLPLWAGAFYLAIFVIRPWEVLFPELAAIRFERVCALLVIMVVVLSGQLRFRARMATFPVYAFLVATAIATVFGVSPGHSWPTLYLTFTVVVFFVVLISVIRTPYDLLFIISSYIVVLGVYVAKAQWNYWVHHGWEMEAHIKRLRGIERAFGDPNTFGPALALSLPLVLFLYTNRRTFTANWPTRWKKWYAQGLVAFVPLAVASIFMTKSRSASVCLVLFLILQASRGAGLGKKLRRLTAVFVLLVGIFFLLPADIQVRLQTMWDPTVGHDYEHESARGRWEGFLAGVEVFRRHPMTGIGPGVFGPYRKANVDGSQLEAHNLTGQLLAETGAIGAFAFGLLLFGIYSACRRLQTLSRDSDDPVIAVFDSFSRTGQEILLLLLFWGLFQHNLFEFQWIWLAAFTLLARKFLIVYLNDVAARTANSLAASVLRPVPSGTGSRRHPPGFSG